MDNQQEGNMYDYYTFKVVFRFSLLASTTIKSMHTYFPTGCNLMHH